MFGGGGKRRLAIQGKYIPLLNAGLIVKASVPTIELLELVCGNPLTVAIWSCRRYCNDKENMVRYNSLHYEKKKMNKAHKEIIIDLIKV